MRWLTSEQAGGLNPWASAEYETYPIENMNNKWFRPEGNGPWEGFAENRFSGIASFFIIIEIFAYFLHGYKQQK